MTTGNNDVSMNVQSHCACQNVLHCNFSLINITDLELPGWKSELCYSCSSLFCDAIICCSLGQLVHVEQTGCSFAKVQTNLACMAWPSVSRRLNGCCGKQHFPSAKSPYNSNLPTAPTPTNCSGKSTARPRNNGVRCRKAQSGEDLFSMKIFTAPQHTRFILPPIHPTKSIAALHGRYFSFSQIKSYVVVQPSKICF